MTEDVPQDFALRAQLELIAGDGRDDERVEVRWFAAGRPRQRFYAADRLEDAARHIANQAALRNDTYVGCAPRRADYRGPTPGGTDAIARTFVMWADCDTPQAVERLDSFAPRPHLVIQTSPGHAHAWWRLAQPLAAEHITRAANRLAHHLGADDASTDIARVLRGCDTYNVKRDCPVRCVEMNVIPHVAIRDLVGNLADPPNEARPADTTRRVPRITSATSDLLLTIAAEDYVVALTGRPVNRTGHVQCPFHKGGQEGTPSLYVRCADERRWKCFACGEPRGDIVAFGARLYDIDPRQPKRAGGKSGWGYHEIRRRLAVDLLGATEMAA